MYHQKIGINHDKYDCKVKSGQSEPFFYHKQNHDKSMNIINVTEQFNRIIIWNYLLLAILISYLTLEILKYLDIKIVQDFMIEKCLKWFFGSLFFSIGEYMFMKLEQLRITAEG